jgi:hypothetical protein
MTLLNLEFIGSLLSNVFLSLERRGGFGLHGILVSQEISNICLFFEESVFRGHTGAHSLSLEPFIV